MPRNMSFRLTERQILDRTKTVTRRLGWKFLKAGDVVHAVDRSMGLGKGQSPRFLARLRIVSVRREELWKCTDEDATREGYPEESGVDFVERFAFHMGIRPGDLVTRIEFEYLE